MVFLTGGFLGVDVFFVISGFLMTTIITKGLKENNVYGRVFATKPPLLNIYQPVSQGVPDIFQNITYKRIEEDKYDVVYIALRWSAYNKGALPSEVASVKKEGNLFYDNEQEKHQDGAALKAGLIDTILYFKNKGVEIYLFSFTCARKQLFYT